MRMEDVELQARALFDELGPRAIATAAQRAAQLESEGDREEASNWRRIQQRLTEKRGARQS
ncbi:hypothetical protein P2H44_10580 [Albimonas sp. CAU 1670]|uniref:hypothetical protein n=1 Tax=Albimonas sp. CAU 1670 TaxID=3032599 RepID=UPI0023DB1EBF|nr:hypothetical protein [Albimonas sp. CAU 1670]MDF2233000.1 hypothetical protein [Albimonas sp. CAU 1670]